MEFENTNLFSHLVLRLDELRRAYRAHLINLGDY